MQVLSLTDRAVEVVKKNHALQMFLRQATVLMRVFKPTETWLFSK